MNRQTAQQIESRFASIEARLDALDDGAEPETEDAEPPPTADELERESRADLDVIANNVGVEKPHDLPNKRAVAEAIVEAR